MLQDSVFSIQEKGCQTIYFDQAIDPWLKKESKKNLQELHEIPSNSQGSVCFAKLNICPIYEFLFTFSRLSRCHKIYTNIILD